MTKLKDIHPGEILLEEFLTPMDISQNALARAIVVPPQKQDIVKCLNEHFYRFK